MGHDITAYVGTITPPELLSVASAWELGEELAYLRGHYGIYEALDATTYDGTVSDIGIGRWFTREQLALAEERLKAQELRWQMDGNSCEPAIRFLRTILDRLPVERDRCYVDFG